MFHSSDQKTLAFLFLEGVFNCYFTIIVCRKIIHRYQSCAEIIFHRCSKTVECLQYFFNCLPCIYSKWISCVYFSISLICRRVSANSFYFLSYSLSFKVNLIDAHFVLKNYKVNRLMNVKFELKTRIITQLSI